MSRALLIRKGFAPILIVVVLGVIGIVGYLVLRPTVIRPPTPSSFLSPTPLPDFSDVTANWKKYINSQYGYSVKHPEGSPPTEHKDEDIYLNFVSFGDRLKEGFLWFEITVRKADLNEEVDYINWQSGHSLVKLTNEEDLSIEDFSAKRLDYEPSKYDEPKPTSFIIINRNQHSYTISSRPEDIDQILSTFRFLD